MKKKVKVDYYEFTDFSVPFPGKVQKRTMFEAKRTYLHLLSVGHRLSCEINGKTIIDDSIFLTFCPFYSDTKTFGRTETTHIANTIEHGDYEI